MILNILIGVIREIVSETTQRGKEEILMDKVQKAIKNSLVTRNYYESEIKERLRKMNIDDNIVDNVYLQLEGSTLANEGGVRKEALIGHIRKLLHAPETQDMLLAMKNLETFRHKRVTRCAALPEEVRGMVEEKTISLIRAKAPEVYRRLEAKMQEKQPLDTVEVSVSAVLETEEPN